MEAMAPSHAAGRVVAHIARADRHDRQHGVHSEERPPNAD
jgi:hypothetical protein